MVNIPFTVAQTAGVCYKVHVMDLGDSSWICDGEIAGTTGQNRRIEALWIQTKSLPRYAKVCFQTHLANIGWTSTQCEDNVQYDANGNLILFGSGTRGESRSMEAVKIWLENAPGWGIQYQIHAQNIGWMGSRRNGEIAGTTGQSRQIEAIKIQLYRR